MNLQYYNQITSSKTNILNYYNYTQRKIKEFCLDNDNKTNDIINN